MHCKRRENISFAVAVRQTDPQHFNKENNLLVGNGGLTTFGAGYIRMGALQGKEHAAALQL